MTIHGTPEITKQLDAAMGKLKGGTDDYARILARVTHYWLAKSKEMGAVRGGDRHGQSFGLSGAGNFVRKAVLQAQGNEVDFSPGKLGAAHRPRALPPAFEKGSLPPVDAFWSLAVYDIRSAKLVENEIQRYSLGDRTPGLVYGDDGSLTIALQAEKPSEPGVNWLPSPRGPLPYIAVMRMYEPRKEALSGDYALPQVVRVE